MWLKKSPKRLLAVRFVLFLIMVSLLFAEFKIEGGPKFKYFTICGVYLTFTVTCIQLVISIKQIKDLEEFKARKIKEANDALINSICSEQ